MFADAYEKVSKFTFPVIISYCRHGGQIECGIGAFIVINPDGWIVTAAHMLQVFSQAQKDKSEFDKYNSELEAINLDTKLNPNQKKNKKRKFMPNNDWIVKQSYWWNGWTLDSAHVNLQADLMIAKLQNFDANAIRIYPKFKDYTKELRFGTSLCKLGFPFHSIKSTYDSTLNQFTLEDGALPAPFFPIEGIFTRQIIVNSTNATSSPDPIPTLFLETSTPGLKGQSGGPIFDKDGNVWAIQSHTNSLPLGFSPRVKHNGRDVTENQFLNVGVGVHVETICKTLDYYGISYER